jgi:hypothetical protein
VIEDVPICPSLAAVIVASPTDTPVTNPVDETVATAVLLDTQPTARPVNTLPLTSLVSADSCRVLP